MMVVLWALGMALEAPQLSVDGLTGWSPVTRRCARYPAHGVTTVSRVPAGGYSVNIFKLEPNYYIHHGLFHLCTKFQAFWTAGWADTV